MFIKTSVALEEEVISSLRGHYPNMSTSQIVREGLNYLLLKKPVIKVDVEYVERNNNAKKF